MAQRRRRKNKRWFGKVLFLMLMIAAVVVCYLVWDNYFKDKETKKQDDTKGEVVQVIEKKEPEQEVEVIKKEEIKQYEGEDPNGANDLTGVLTYVGVAGDELIIRVNIDQYLTSGTCRLTLSQDGVTIYNGMAEIMDSASTATCVGFNIPTANLNSGEVDIKIELNADGKRGVIAGGVEL